MKKIITLIFLFLSVASYGQGVNTLEIKKVDEQSSINSETKLMVWDSTNFGKVKYKKLGDLSIDNALNYVTVTDSTYTLLEADILAYKPHIIESYRADGTTPSDTLVVTYPRDITPPANEMLAVTFTNVSGSALKIIPDSTLVIDRRTKTQRQYVLPKDYLGSASLFSISKDTIWANSADWVISDYTPPTTTTELWTADASSLDNEANDVSKWNGFFASVETSDTNGSTYAVSISGGGIFSIDDIEITGLTIGDSITIEFDAKCNTQNEQSVSIGNTSDNSAFWTAGNQPTTWTSYSRTVTMTATTLEFNIQASLGGGVAGDKLIIDNLSIIKN